LRAKLVRLPAVPDAPAPSSALDRSPASILSWAAYLACSWTWCIGMFLPVLLWRDFGPWGFVAFVVPNILGAAEMGFLLAKPGASERFVAAHAPACRAFGVVTIAFQLFFLVWMAQAFGAPAWLIGLGVLGAAWIALVPGTPASGWRSEAPLVWLASIGCAVWFILRRGGVELPVAPAAAPPLDLAGLALVCTLGFLFCPYLDLTFHRARQKTAPGAGKLAFALGFGVLFAAMIAFTLLYAVELTGIDFGTPRSIRSPYLVIPVAAHVIMQLIFTIGVHGTELRRRGQGVDWSLVLPVLFAFALGGVAAVGPGYAGLTFGEVVYRCFMAFYALVFPAYVWICASPIARTARPTARMLTVFAAAVMLAGPCYWMASIEREAWWFIPGVAIVLVARSLRGRGAQA
jgi:hypothetical protein